MYPDKLPLFLLMWLGLCYWYIVVRRINL